MAKTYSLPSLTTPLMSQLMNQSTVDIETINGDDDHSITATNMVITPIDCDERCNATVTVTWTNTGKEKTKFMPTIKINGTKMELGRYITLRENQTTTQTFNLTNLMEGTYEICPYPN